MKFLSIILALLALPARADVAFLAAPRTTGKFLTPSLSEGDGPYHYSPATQLILRDEAGAERVLVDGNVLDFTFSLDGQAILYSQVTAPRASDDWARGDDGRRADVFRISLTPGAQPTKLTNQDSWNCQPVELPTGEIAFLSSRDGWINPHENYRALTIYKMGPGGDNQRRIWHAGLGGVFGLSLGPDGRLYFASGENQGFNSGTGNGWSVWSVNPDGSQFEPEFTAVHVDNVCDWPVMSSDRSLVFARYYDTRIYGTIVACPQVEANPQNDGPTKFGKPLRQDNPQLKDGYYTGSGGYSFSWQRRGAYNLTECGSEFDYENKHTVDGVTTYNGMFSHPFPIPGNGIYCTWTGDKGDAAMDLGVYAVPDVTNVAEENSELVKVVDRPDRHEWMGKQAVPYAAIYGANPPTPTGPKAEGLPLGSPYGVIGTSAVDVNEWVTNANNFGQNQLITMQPDEAEYVRVLAMNPTLDKRVPGIAWNDNGSGLNQGRDAQVTTNTEGFITELNERVGFYDQLIPIKKWRKAGSPDVYGPDPGDGYTRVMREDGRPDTSWAAEIPANQPWSLQLLNAKKEAIHGSTAQTWHQVISREQRTNCQGCHAHWKPDTTEFSATLAGQPDYPRKRLTKAVRVQYERDIVPLGLSLPIRPWAAADGNHRTYESGNEAWNDAMPEIVATWQDTGFLAGVGALADTMPPTLVVEQGVIGAADPDSGLASVSVNGTLVTLDANGTAPYGLPDGTAATFVATDNAGNTTTRTLTVEGTEPPAPRTPAGVYVDRLDDLLGKIRSMTPDGEKDHHIKLTGLDGTRRVIFIDIKAGTDADATPDWKKWSTDAGEESPAHPAGLWWWIKQQPLIAAGPTDTLDLWFSKASPTQNFSEYRVYVYYSATDLADRDFIRITAPDDCAATQAALQAQIDELNANLGDLKAGIRSIADQLEALGQ